MKIKNEAFKNLDFGDYCSVEQKRFGTENEMYQYKVIGRLYSNGYMDVPVTHDSKKTLHDEIVEVITCVCCGVCEDEIVRFSINDVSISWRDHHKKD